MERVNADWPQQVLDFWFKELTKKEWFDSSQTLDNTINDRFRSAHSLVKKWRSLPLDADQHRSLAAIIVLDQFSRNIFRGTKDAFGCDSLALSLAKQTMARELDQHLSDDEKQFIYMPFIHSENLDDQKKAVSLFTEMGRAEHAEKHLAIFEQFNRFPHRNAVLGRESTDQEIEFLKDAPRFGQ